MKRKKLFVLLMIFCMTLTMMPTMAFATDGTDSPAVSSEQPEAASEEVQPEAKSQEPVQAAEPEKQSAAEESTATEEAKSEEQTEEEVAPEDPEAEAEAEEEAEPFDATKSDYLSYDPLYVAHYANPKYVNVDEVSLDRYVNVVTAAKGVATYNVDKQKDFKFKEGNYLASMNYQMPVYNVDDDSDYYIAIPNVNKFNGNFKAYDLTVAYNNDMAELVSGWKYEKGILYIPKSAVDNPKNDYETPEGILLAVQLNYSMGDDMEFTKSIPVQILKKDEPVEKKVHTANLFDLETLTVSTGVKNRDSEDITVFLNGQMIPINDDAWLYDKSSGNLQIFAMPGVVSSINIVFENQKMIDDMKDAAVSAMERLADEAYAVTQANMTLFKNTDDKEVVITVPSWMFVGWRGKYKAKIDYGKDGRTDERAESDRKQLHGWKESINYLYGGASNIPGSGEGWLDSNDGKKKYDANFVELWSVASYAAGADLGMITALDDRKVTRDMQVTHWVGHPFDEDASASALVKEKKTIYEWMMEYRNDLKKSKYVTKNMGDGSGNGIGGANNFALTFPTAGSVVSGCENPAETSGNLVSDPNAEGYNLGNPDFTFNVDGLGDGDYWFAASCNELQNAASDGGAGKANRGDTGTTYVTCLGIDWNAKYAVFAFTQVRSSKQDATAIYKFKIDKDSSIGVLAIRKGSTDSTVNDLSTYDLAGAKYKVFSDQACTKPVKKDGNDVVLVTDSYGNAGPVELEIGGKSQTFYVKETDAPEGYLKDERVYPVTLSSGPSGGASTGTSIKYTAYRDGANGTIGQTTIFSTTSNGVSYTGTCRQLGVSMAPSGTGTVAERIPNDSRLAKIIYNYGVVNGWWGKNRHLSANGVLKLNNGSTVTLQRLIEAAIQIQYQGESYWKSLWGRSANQTTLNAVINWCKTANVTGVVVPDTFEIYNVTPAGNAQAFTIWANNTTSTETVPVVLNVADTPIYGRPNLRIFKVGDTDGFDPTTLNGAEFTIKYYDVANKADIASAKPERTWTFVTKQKPAPQGASETSLAAFDWMTDEPVYSKSDEFYEDDTGRALPLGWFTIEETVAPPGYKLNSTKIYGQVKLASNGQSATTVIDGATADAKLGMETVTVTDKSNTVTISKKNSATGSELAGAKLQILKGSTVVVPTWTTTATPKVITGLDAGTYTLREIEAPYGYDLADDVTFTFDRTKDMTVTMTNTPVTVKTTAVDAATKKHVGSRKTSSKITDTVHMTGLIKDRKYRLTGVLMNKRTGQAVPNVTVSPKEFTATGATMDVTMDFTFNSAALGEGDSVVVYETLYRTSKVHSDETVIPKELQKHQDINDKDQTITYPSISTTAVDQSSQTHNLLAGPGATIVDTVTYKGLAVGDTYTLEGELYDKTTKKLTGIKKSEKLVPNAVNGTATINFTFDATAYKGHTLVVYETLKQGNPGTETLVEHKNPDDEAQTIYLPDVRTTLKDPKSKDHLSNASETITLNDEVVCTNLIVGRTYTISGKLVFKDNGNDVLDNGKTVTAETQPFKATATTMTQTLTFKFNGSALEGKTVVAFEDLTTNYRKVGTHADLTDEDQSDHIPKVRTTALDSETNDHIALGDEKITIHDTVSYENLVPGKTYTVTGKLMDKTTGKEVSNVTSQPVQFKPDKANGTVVVDFVFNGKNWQNHKTVAFEKLYLGTKEQVKPDNLIATHEDINDNDQTVRIPEGGTTLLDSETSDHIAYGDESVTLIDTVEYKNLIPGKDYVAKGTLMNKRTGEPIKVNGQNVTGETPFKANSENGTVEVKFVFNGLQLPGETVVAFETIEYKKVPVIIHANINDAAQTMPIPKIRTIAAISDDNHVFTDTINYENLLPDRKYVFRGWLVDTATGKKIAGSDGKVELTATAANVNGSVKMEMNTAEYDTMYGHSMTAYEELYVIEKKDGKDTEIKVAEHKDRSGDQSTNPQIVEIYHDLKVQKNVTGNLGDLTKIFEYTVEFTDLVPNKEYKVEGDDAKTFKAGADGKATLELKLADDQEAVIKQLPKSATYVVTEAASDHIAQYKIFSEDMEKKGAKIVTKEANNGAEAAKILATAKETVDLFDGTIVVLWENNRDIATLTGVQTYLGIWAGALALVLAGIVTILVRRRKYSSEL